MKKALVAVVFFIIAALAGEASGFHVGIQRNVTKKEIISSLTEVVRLFDEHANKMGGAGFWYGVKSKFVGWFSDSHRDLLQKYLMRTPEHMLYASGIREEDPALGRRFVEFARAMPTVYDTHESCREKIRRSVKMIFPGENDKFYENIMHRMRESTGADWI